MVEVRRLAREEVLRHLPGLARLRIEIFRDYPYLYEGSPAYEERYLGLYAETADSAVIAALDGERLVGAATALPLRHEPAELTAPVAAFGLPVEEVFYFGESVLLPAYRGQGIGVAFFREREAAALAQPPIRWAAFCAVVRPAGHPRQPVDHVPLDGFWRRRGYERAEGLRGRMAWRDLDQPEETAKDMQFWIKCLR